jgi:acyl carrier protein
VGLHLLSTIRFRDRRTFVDVAVDVSKRVNDFIRNEILFEDPNVELKNDTPLLKGIIDSLGLTQLVSFLEAEFDIEIDDADITADNLGTIRLIEDLVRRRMTDD